VSGAKPQRPGDVEGFVGLQSPCDVDVAGNKFYFTGIFVSIRAIKDSTTKLLWGSGVPEPPQDRRLYLRFQILIAHRGNKTYTIYVSDPSKVLYTQNCVILTF